MIFFFVCDIFLEEGTNADMTIYRQEGSRGGKRNPRSAKFPSLSRERNSVKSLPPIYEIDEDGEEVVFLDVKDNRNLPAGRLGKVCREKEGKCSQENTSVPHGEHWDVHRKRKQQQKYREFPRNRGRNSSVTSYAEGNSQMLFPDFFPPGMHVHCAQNALPEASKGLYMKIVQGEADLEHERNVCKTNKTTSNNSSNKQQNWMQFFG